MNLIGFVENLQNYSEDLITLMGIVLILNVINWIFLRSFLNILGIWPRSLIGLPGIIFAALLHGNATHFFLNAIPFYCLSLLTIAIIGFHHYVLTSIAITLLSGLFIWFFARPGVHIGASAMITGLFSWLIYNAFLNPNPLSLAILMIVLFYFGSMIAGILPAEPGVSWEGHLLGFISGAIIARYQEYMIIQGLVTENAFYRFLNIKDFSELILSWKSYAQTLYHWF